MIAYRSGLYAGRPADQEWNAVTAFVDVGLGAAPDMVGLMVLRVIANGAEVFDMVRLAFVDAEHEGAVVTGHDDDGVVGLLGLVQDFEDLADGIVGLNHEVAVDTVLGLAFEPGAGNDRFVWRSQREIEKEGFLRGSGFADELDRAPVEGVDDGLEVEVRRFRAAADNGDVVCRARFEVGGRLREPVAVDVGVGVHVE